MAAVDRSDRRTHPAGVVGTPDDTVFVLRTPLTPPEVDPAVSRLVCDWRRGNPW
jgi:hypothetical protein